MELNLVTLVEPARAAFAAIQEGTIDATFRAVGSPVSLLPPDLEATPAVDEPHQLLVGPSHPLANASSVTPIDLAEHRLWMPGMLPGSEWDRYYDDLATAFGLTIERVGPHFGTEYILDVLADSSTLGNLSGEHTRYLWPDRYDLRRIPIVRPIPVYPLMLVWHRDNPHPAIDILREHLHAHRTHPTGATWTPSWVHK